MVLTPADVHNVAFSRPRIGKRGYDEQEVDLFIDLVEQELTRHLSEEGELRSRCAEFRNRDGGLAQREAQLSEREATVGEHECELHRQENQLRQQAAEFARRAAQVAGQKVPLPQQVAQLRHREAQVAQREARLAQRQAEVADHEAQLAQREGELSQREAELRRLDEQRAVAARIGTQQLRAVPTPAAVNGAPRLEEVRTVASLHGRHDMERMAIRAVTDALGNTVTETVHERALGGPLDHGRPDAGSQQPELERLRQENAELTQSLRLLKSAAALLAAALNRP